MATLVSAGPIARESENSNDRGHKSSMFGLNQHLGRYHELDFCDFLSDPNEMPDMDLVGARGRFEAKLNMNL